MWWADQQQHVLVGGRAHDRDPQRRINGKVEGDAEFTLRQHLEAQSLGLF